MVLWDLGSLFSPPATQLNDSCQDLTVDKANPVTPVPSVGCEAWSAAVKLTFPEVRSGSKTLESGSSFVAALRELFPCLRLCLDPTLEPWFLATWGLNLELLFYKHLSWVYPFSPSPLSTLSSSAAETLPSCLCWPLCPWSWTTLIYSVHHFFTQQPSHSFNRHCPKWWDEAENQTDQIPVLLH